MGASGPALQGIHVDVHLFSLESGPALGLSISLGKAPLLVVAVPQGYVMCGYLNMETANRLGDCAARVTGVSSFDGLLAAQITAVSDAAKTQGLHEGMTAREFLNALGKNR